MYIESSKNKGNSRINPLAVSLRVLLASEIKLILLVCAILMVACTTKTKNGLTDSGLKRSDFLADVDGGRTNLFVLKNKNNMRVCVTNFGGRIVSVMVLDKDGVMRDISTVCIQGSTKERPRTRTDLFVKEWRRVFPWRLELYRNYDADR